MPAGPSRCPRYGTADVGLLVRDALAALTGSPRTLPDLPLPAGLRAVIVLVVDGLGRRQLDAHPGAAPALAGAPGLTLDAPFPATTATSLTSIGTGLPPGEHGVTGSVVGLPGEARPLFTLTWSWERQDAALDARDDVVPERFQPAPTLFETAAETGVRTVTVLRPEFATSGLTRVGLRGGRVVPAAGLAETLRAAVDVVSDGAGQPTLVYAHHGDLDALGHLTGPGSDRWSAELATIDAAITAAAAALPPGVALVVTADHGMVAVPPEGFVELADEPELARAVRVFGGDPRARQLSLRTGAIDEVHALCRERFAGLADVRTRDEAIAAGWFGPAVSPHARERIGDVLLVATRPDIAFVHRDRDPFGGRLTGQHAALLPDELEVPVAVLTG